MKPSRLAVLCVLGLLLSVAGCAAPATPEAVPPAPSPQSTATSSPAPEQLPTAAPLWTATPLPPSPAATAQSKTATPENAGEISDPNIAAVVNGVVITKAAYDQQLAQAQRSFLQQPGLDIQSEAGQQALRALQTQVLAWMIDQVLIQQAAAARGLTVSEAMVEATVARMRGTDQARFEKWLAANGLTLEALRQQIRLELLTAAVRDAITANLPRKEPQVHVRHILLADEAAAQAALQQLKQGENFIALARRISEDETTRASGGDLGFLPKGVMPPAFEQVAFALKPGEISGVVRGEAGFHIIQLVELDPSREIPPEYWPLVQQRVFDAWLAEQRAQAKIQRNPALLPR